MISIVIPVWNLHEMTAECIASVVETTKDCEIIIVDNGSDPEIAAPPGWLESTHFGSTGKEYMPEEGEGNIVILRNEENLGFPAAVNQGVRAAKGDTVILLNNDVIVTPGWADRLVAHLADYSIVGPLTNYCAGAQRTVIPSYEDQDELCRNAAEWGAKHSGKSVEVNWLIGFCFAFRRSLFDEIGAFDESIWPSSGEEIDFCFRARGAGHRIGIARDVYVHHEGSVTFKEMQEVAGVDYAKHCAETSSHLSGKWGGDFWSRQHVAPVKDDGSRINLGCGRFHLEGFVDIDQDPDVNPDLVCDIMALPYEAGTISEIYAGHVLEHFDWTDGEKALGYWHGLLKSGGKISISVPDFDVLAERYMAAPTTENLREMNDLYIYSYRQKSPHKYAYSGALLREVMEGAGFINLERMPVDHPYFPHPVTWQVGYEGVRA